MMLPANSLNSIPITPNRLNFIISQSKKVRKQKPPIIFEGQNMYQTKMNGNMGSHKNILSGIQSNKLNFEQVPTMNNYAINNKSSRKNHVSANPHNISINGLEHSGQRIPYHCADSLDLLVTDRISAKAGENCQLIDRKSHQSYDTNRKTQKGYLNNYNIFANNETGRTNGSFTDSYPYLNQSFQLQTNRSINKYDNQSLNDFDNLSPLKVLKKSQNIQFFDHQNQKQIYAPKKKVVWNLEPLNEEEEHMYQKNMYNNFKQISRELCKINYQLNSNSVKLQDMNKLYENVKKKKLSPQQVLKRVNSKYANFDRKQNIETCQIRRKPLVQYQDKIYRDPRYLIWQPQH